MGESQIGSLALVPVVHVNGQYGGRGKKINLFRSAMKTGWFAGQMGAFVGGGRGGTRLYCLINVKTGFYRPTRAELAIITA